MVGEVVATMGKGRDGLMIDTPWGAGDMAFSLPFREGVTCRVGTANDSSRVATRFTGLWGTGTANLGGIACFSEIRIRLAGVDMTGVVLLT
jgi:hypothetical protein